MTGLPDNSDHAQFDAQFDDDTLHEECGVFGIFGHPDAGALTVLGLHALQHRGQEAAGIVTYDGTQFIAERHAGLVGDIFGKNSAHAQKLKGAYAVGHKRYSTTGGSSARNIQPMFADLAGGGIAIAHNGNLTNARMLRTQLVQAGAIFHSTSDTETIIHLVARSTRSPIVDRADRCAEAGRRRLFAGGADLQEADRRARSLRRAPAGAGHARRRADPGVGNLRARHHRRRVRARHRSRARWSSSPRTASKAISRSRRSPNRFCVFEYIYFARPDSIVEGRNVYEARKRIGEELARESPADADIVIPVPDSGVPAALGYSAISGLPFELGIIRNHYVGRTFIEPSDRIRHLGVRLKHNPNRAMLKGKRVVLVDDSIVRGTTSKKIVEMVRDAGATEVHFRIASPPTTHSCFYGVDTPNTEELLAHRMDVEEMRRYINADSLAFISMDGLYRAMGERQPQRRGTAILRRLLLRRLPDRPGRCEWRREGSPAFAAGRSRLRIFPV